MASGPGVDWRVHVLGYLATAGLVVSTILFLRNRVKKSAAQYRHSHESDWIFLVLILVVALTGILQHILHRSGLDVAANVTYIVHLSLVVPMLALEVPFSKWSHLAYRPLAIYLARVRRDRPGASAPGRRSAREAPSRPHRSGRPEEVGAMAEPRTGVFICNCGTNIAKVVDCDAVAEAASAMPGVVVARSYKYMCSNPGQEMIAQDIGDHGLERVVVAACSPRMHEPTFRRAAETAGLNPYLVEMANIREQCSWVHDDGARATEKAEDLVRAAVMRVAHHEPLERLSVDMCPNTLVIGGGIAA